MGEVLGGRYELVDLIGAGGMGSVWRARDLQENRIVAAKVLRQSDAATLLRFVREQSTRIHHPHVVAPLGWVGDDHRVLFTMQVVNGGSLATLIGDHGPLPPRFTAEILRQVLAGLGPVHAARIVHRDIKPANILLDATGTGRPHAYLSDFGIAIDLDGPRFTETGYVHGTPGYLAPELTVLGQASPAVDVYAVGMVGLTMLTGLKPDQIDVTTAPSTVPAELWTILTAMVAPEPQRRPNREAALAQLSQPSLAWTPDAIGSIEVLEQLGPLPTTPATPVTAPMPRPLPPAPPSAAMTTQGPPPQAALMQQTVAIAPPRSPVPHSPVPMVQAMPYGPAQASLAPSQPAPTPRRAGTAWLVAGSGAALLGGIILLVVAVFG